MDVSSTHMSAPVHAEALGARKEAPRIASYQRQLPATEILPSNGMAALLGPVGAPPPPKASTSRRTSRTSRKRMRREETQEHANAHAANAASLSGTSTSAATDLAKLGVTTTITDEDLEAVCFHTLTHTLPAQ